ncbi:hypothetical protein IKQ26_09495 [bacterium]|nr:hypothetical protein [bacterium]
MLNPQLLKLMIEMQSVEDYDEEEEENKFSGGSKRKLFELKKREYATIPIRYHD